MIFNKKLLIATTAILFVALTSRPGITTIGTVSKRISHDLNLSSFQVGLLTSIPILCFGLLAVFIPKLNKTWGYVKSIYLALALMTAGFVVRMYPNVPLLYLGTLIIGIAITFINILLPAYIKASHPHNMGSLTTTYSLAIALAPALATAFTVPIANHFHSWLVGINIWILLIPLALLTWFRETKSLSLAPLHSHSIDFDLKDISVWKQPLAWAVALFFGLKSTLFFSVIAWLPSILMDKSNFSDLTAGRLLSLTDAIGLPATLIFTPFIFKTKNQRWATLLGPLFFLVGVSLLFLTTPNLSLAIVITLILGAGIALNGAVGYSLPLLRSKNPNTALKLTAMAQTIGYTIAAIGPTLTGKIHDNTNSWNPILLGAMLVFLILMGIGFKAGSSQKI